jgi:membrane-bound serine protease (ClpP class)
MRRKSFGTARICALLLLVWLMPRFAFAAGLDDDLVAPESRAPSQSSVRRVLMLDLQGPVGPATASFIATSLEQAASRNAELLIIRMDTPGGLDAATRDIIKAILNAPLPVATFVAPEGARAASAGTYILYASHIAAMSPATNVGAATPVDIIGGKPPGQSKPPGKDDEEPAAEPDSTDTMSRKAINDAVAYARGLAAKRGRNADWVELAIRDAASIPAEEALQLGVIDLIAKNVNDLLTQVDGRTVNVRGRDWVVETKSSLIEQLEPDWKTRFLGVITSPTIAYILLMIGIYGLILEGYNPGAILPGVVGAISLLLALYAFQMLPINYAGVGLIVLGVILMIAEVMAPSFGALGIGGVISLVIGSVILIDTDAPGFVVSRPLIGAIALASSLGLLAIIGLAVKTRKRPIVAGREELTGAAGEALEDFDNLGFVFVHGERWRAHSQSRLLEGQAIVVTGIDGLTLEVRPADQAEPCCGN